MFFAERGERLEYLAINDLASAHDDMSGLSGDVCARFLARAILQEGGCSRVGLGVGADESGGETREAGLRGGETVFDELPGV